MAKNLGIHCLKPRRLASSHVTMNINDEASLARAIDMVKYIKNGIWLNATFRDGALP